jgi:hypothetical protein
MARLCRVCQHPKREEIDLALLLHRDAYQAIAGRYGIVKSSLQRHEQAHLKMSWEKSKELSAMLSSSNLLDKLGQWHERMEQQYANADAAGNVLAAVATARTGISALESIAKRTIDIDDNEQRFQALEEALKKLRGGEA